MGSESDVLDFIEERIIMSLAELAARTGDDPASTGDDATNTGENVKVCAGCCILREAVLISCRRRFSNFDNVQSTEY